MLRLDVADRIPHLAGQHYVIRLSAPDGYRAQRSYSVASPASDPFCEFFVERLDDGEVSTYLADVLMVGDVLDVRGPIGGWFVWNGSSPAVGVAGGTGVVPLRAMQRLADDLGRPGSFHIVVSSRTLAELPYAAELSAAGTFIALSREPGPAGRGAGRISSGELASQLVEGATYYVCGSARFAEAASEGLIGVGVAAESIRVERFGPSG